MIVVGSDYMVAFCMIRVWVRVGYGIIMILDIHTFYAQSHQRVIIKFFVCAIKCKINMEPGQGRYRTHYNSMLVRAHMCTCEPDVNILVYLVGKKRTCYSSMLVRANIHTCEADVKILVYLVGKKSTLQLDVGTSPCVHM